MKQGWYGVAALIGLLLVAPRVLTAQDSTAKQRLILGITYTGGARPGLIVIGAPGLDSVRRIIERDLLANSDHYETAVVPDSVNSSLISMDALKGMGVRWGVLLTQAMNGVQVRLYNLISGEVVQDVIRPLDLRGEGDGRLAIHSVSDEIQEWTGEGKGIAATRLMFKMAKDGENRLWRMDSDGQNVVAITRPGTYLAPAWAPDGGRIAYSEWSDGVWTLWVQTLRSGTRNRVQSNASNTFPVFSPDGTSLAFVRDGEKGADIVVVSVSSTICCESIKNHTRFADNNRPAYSPNGQRLAFVTNRAGSRQIWVMDSDGSLPSALIVPESGNAGAPAWSPDGTTIAYSEAASGGGQQVFTYRIGSGLRTPITASGRNDMPSWAPDSRHLVVKSTRSGREQLMIFDTVTGNSRTLSTPGAATFPAWSPALGATNSKNGGPP